LLAGLALSILLLFLLSNWLGIPDLPQQTRTSSKALEVWAQPFEVDGQGMVLRQPNQPATSASAAASPDKANAQAVQDVNVAKQAQQEQQEQAESKETQATSSLQAVHIPKDIRLSAEELADLSPKERERYQDMRAAFVELREQALELQREREALEQRMLEMERRNQALSETLQAQPLSSEE